MTQNTSVGYIPVPTTRTVNSKALSSDISLTASDVGAATTTDITYETLNTNGDVGSTSGTVCAGDDSRLSDSRTPTSHGNEAHSTAYQPADATLTAFAGLTTAANKLPYATGEDTFGVCDFTPLGQSLIGTTTASAVRDLIAAASSTTATQNIYVDSAATGAGTGVDWTNAFTTIQAAVDSLPAVINHAVTIWIRKGTTAYAENVTIQRVVAAGSITIRGEYYWWGTVAATATGKITLGSGNTGYADRAQIAVGDVIWATKWSGAVGASALTESIIDTVSSVSGAEVSLTTNTGKTIDKSWTYYIMHTKFAFTGSNRITLLFGSVLINGIHLHSSNAAQIAVAYNGSKMTLNTCAITSDVNVSCIRGESRAHIAISNTLIKSNGSGTGIYLLGRTLLDMKQCVLSGLDKGLSIGASDSNNWLEANHIMNTVNIGIDARGNSYIRVATGSWATLNEAVTPKSPATSSEGSYIQ